MHPVRFPYEREAFRLRRYSLVYYAESSPDVDCCDHNSKSASYPQSVSPECLFATVEAAGSPPNCQVGAIELEIGFYVLTCHSRGFAVSSAAMAAVRVEKSNAEWKKEVLLSWPFVVVPL
jgi:hypothetical protein